MIIYSVVDNIGVQFIIVRTYACMYKSVVDKHRFDTPTALTIRRSQVHRPITIR